MSQTSLVETSSSDELPRFALGNTSTTTRSGGNSLRLIAPPLVQESPLPLSGVEQSFTLNGRYIYDTATGSATATYHVSTRNTQSGKPWQLQVSRLLPSETRRLSVAAAAATAANNNNSGSGSGSGSVADAPFIRYDDDLTLYSGEKLTVPISIGQKPLLVIRGQKRGTTQGSIVLERSGSGSGSRGGYKFWHMIPIRRALTKAENERMAALMLKRGYRDSDDWKKKLLLSVRERSTRGSKEQEWIDENDALVAVERDGRLDITARVEMEKRDLIVACWACKNFVLDKSAESEAGRPSR